MTQQIKVRAYCTACGSGHTLDELNIPHLEEDKLHWSETETVCKRCGEMNFHIKYQY